MRNLLGLFSYAAVITVSSPVWAKASKPLPNYATPEELAKATAADWELPMTLRDAIKPPSGLRLPAEYEPIAGVVMTYTSYPTFIQNIAKAVVGAGAHAYVLGGPSSLSGVDSSQYTSLKFSYNSIWSRDYGPVAINEETGQLAIVDNIYRHYAVRKYDDAIPTRLAEYFGMESYASPLILDGGNLMTDKRGHLYMTEVTYTWNSSLTRAQVDQNLKDYFGVKEIHVVPFVKNSSGSPADGTGHIDMIAKVVADCKVIVAKSTTAPYSTTLETVANSFATAECAPGKKWDVYRLQAYASGGVWYTFTNSLIVNNTVIIPSYASYDSAEARRVYGQALPGYKLVFVNSDDPIRAAGAIHCTTKEIPAIN